MTAVQRTRRSPQRPKRGPRRKRLRNYCPGLELLESRVTPSLFVVNTTLDTPVENFQTGQDGSGNISLRSAIQAANARLGPDTILFRIGAPGSQQIIQLQPAVNGGGLPPITDDLTIDALVAALQRGARVRIITPGPIMDSQTVRGASRAAWGPLLEAGALMSEYQPTMFHCKVFTVDGLLVSVGSTNFDNRSFRLNDEANLNIYDEAFARAQTAQFEVDLSHSRRLTLQAWRERPMGEKLMEHVASLLSAQL